MPQALLLLGELLQHGLFRISDRFTGRWQPCSAETFLVIATLPGGAGGPVQWRVDLAAKTLALAGDQQPGQAADPVRWQVVGTADAWAQAITGRANLPALLRHRDLRYCDTGDPVSTSITRVGMLADLLAITSWPSPADPAVRQPASAA
jgi:hypothetical protein